MWLDRFIAFRVVLDLLRLLARLYRLWVRLFDARAWALRDPGFHSSPSP